MFFWTVRGESLPLSVPLYIQNRCGCGCDTHHHPAEAFRLEGGRHALVESVARGGPRVVNRRDGAAIYFKTSDIFFRDGNSQRDKFLCQK